MLDPEWNFSDDGPTKFWEGNRAWLLRRGINLYSLAQRDQSHEGKELFTHWCTPVRSCTPAGAPQLEGESLPWARCAEGPRREAFWLPSKYIAPARDPSGRDVILKVIDRHGVENTVSKALLDAVDYTDPSTFPCIVPPLAVLDTPYHYSFLCMPRWGTVNWFYDIDTPREFLRFAGCLLRALEFLHSRRIAHRDIIPQNMLSDSYTLDSDKQLVVANIQERRSQGDIDNITALMDLGAAFVFPRGKPLAECILLSSEAIGNRMFAPDDLERGAPYHNPFSYDVGMLGNILRYHFWHMASAVPSLAPLFDRMTTYVIHERFTAEEALRFFKDTTTQVSDEALNTKFLTPETEARRISTGDVYWSRLSPQDQEFWKRYRTPPEAWWIPLVRWLLQFHWPGTLFFSIRWWLKI
ncbi:uncharacterized protein BXZ73DRAFT_39441 [Epithele typhae]|uniref:uncharacterized protein n=1 Tax=Epithele typhae TaxID=378194 RepID=UPI0020079411|nr:uncharacterized protein BXZ73DRAFT_39441 [Epithele typhae]KAH9944555.1 hypothetical protein BXZ73DRAFT_39441 [Epithele typhae]